MLRVLGKRTKNKKPRATMEIVDKIDGISANPTVQYTYSISGHTIEVRSCLDVHAPTEFQNFLPGYLPGIMKTMYLPTLELYLVFSSSSNKTKLTTKEKHTFWESFMKSPPQDIQCIQPNQEPVRDFISLMKPTS